MYRRPARCIGLGGVDRLAMPGEQVSLGRVHRPAIPIDFALGRRDVFAPIFVVVKQRATDAERIPLENRALPQWRQHCPCSTLPTPFDQVFDQFDVAPSGKIASNSSAVAWNALKVAFEAPSMIWMFFMMSQGIGSAFSDGPALGKKGCARPHRIGRRTGIQMGELSLNTGPSLHLRERSDSDGSPRTVRASGCPQSLPCPCSDRHP